MKKGVLESQELLSQDFFLGQENEDSKNLLRSEDLSFLIDEKSILESGNSSWSLVENESRLDPLIFSNGKNQEQVVREVIQHIKNGSKIILIHGSCGTGKSAIALNIARELGKTSIVVPVKGLQRQYEEDYSKRKHIVGKNGKKLKIAMITGRDNHDSIFFPGKSCADPLLPENIIFTSKNLDLLDDYYKKNPNIKNKRNLEVYEYSRMSVAPANPYWSPILPSIYEAPLKDAKKIRYRGLRGRDFVFYHRNSGCSYYDQYLAYKEADVLVFNSAKYKIEVLLDRKPETQADIIDEADEFLDNFTSYEEISLNRLSKSINNFKTDVYEAEKSRKILSNLIALEEGQKKALGVDEKSLFIIKDTHWNGILKAVVDANAFTKEVLMDEGNYVNKLIEVAETFRNSMTDTYIMFRKKDDEIIVSFVSSNLSRRFGEIIEKCNALVLMSGTLHSNEVLKKVFGIEDFKIVEAETSFLGSLETEKTGMEFDCRYSNFSAGKNKREDYLKSLNACLKKAKRPVLVHVNAFEDLPSETEKAGYFLDELMSREMLKALQNSDKTGNMISMFKKGLSDVLFSTRCSRGVDFPGEQCNSIVFTKYPNPNVQGIFWKVFQKTHPEYYWAFYKDKARREFLQRIYRGLRSKDDKVYILSPDLRVLNSIEGMKKDIHKL